MPLNIKFPMVECDKLNELKSHEYHHMSRDVVATTSAEIKTATVATSSSAPTSVKCLIARLASDSVILITDYTFFCLFQFFGIKMRKPNILAYKQNIIGFKRRQPDKA